MHTKDQGNRGMNETLDDGFQRNMMDQLFPSQGCVLVFQPCPPFCAAAKELGWLLGP